ncbi:hypothetical protein, partial [Sansalvadorimonas verongulae]|uniref:hypothetical protein n=1 Tax=Sansalvadorimonas verongulae TaxID=2172824 RepID=UPI001E329835
PCMDALVSDEVAGCAKCFVASVLITGVAPVSCMDALVSGESAGLGEGPVASVLITGVAPVPCAGS